VPAVFQFHAVGTQGKPFLLAFGHVATADKPTACTQEFHPKELHNKERAKNCKILKQ
jgi:hypothetical protein